jgi:hypothetical protein
MTVSSPARLTSKCSKPAGESCRLHNPSSGSIKNFTTVNDVFKKLEEEASKRKTKTSVKKETVKGSSFQKITDTRKLPDGISLNLDEHVAQSKKNLEHLTDEDKIALGGYTGFGAGVCNTILLGSKYEYYDKAPRWKESEGPCDFVDREDLVSYMETMDSLLENRSKEPQIVYRGIPIYDSLHDEIGSSIGKELQLNDTEGLVEGLQEYYKQGKIFNYDTYLSTTHSAHYAAKRTENSSETKDGGYYGKPAEIKGIMFELKTNAGLDVTGAARSHYAHEREVVLPRDTHFKVTNVYVKPEKYDTISGYDRKPDRLEEKTYTQLAVVVQMVEVDKDGNEITHTQPHKPRKAIEDIVPK